MDTRITWKPATCKMVLQAYQQGKLVGEYGKHGGVASGTVSARSLTEGAAGSTELKIWVPNAPMPAHAVWVIIEPDE